MTHKNLQTTTFPILYKKSAKGQIRFWKIWTEGRTIYTRYGVMGGKDQVSMDIIKSGKNLGKKNETTPEEQAQAEAQSLYTKYIDRGYSLTEAAAKKGVAAVAPKGLSPMLAKEYMTIRNKVSGPVYVQNKLDGVRCIIHKGTSLSRTAKPLRVSDTIMREVTNIFPEYAVDGELYNHEMRDGIEKIVSASRSTKGKEDLLSKVQYHIYDLIIPNLTYTERRKIIKSRMEGYKGSSLVRVRTAKVSDTAILPKLLNRAVAEGYEGIMIRQPRSFYEVGKRSVGLLKYKKMFRDEFRIVGIKEGKGKRMEAVGAFICQFEDRTFDVSLSGAGVTEFLRDAFKDHSLWKDKWMVVEYMKITTAKKVPRQPVGIKIVDK